MRHPGTNLPEPPDPHRIAGGPSSEIHVHHGLVVVPGESVDGFVTIVGVTGHDADGREYRRVYSYTSPGMDRVDVEELLRGKQRMMERRRTPSAPLPR